VAQIWIGADTCLQTLTHAGWKHVVLSNHVPELPALVEALNLTPHIAQVFTSALVGFEKPHPQSYEAVLSAYPNARALMMVGDNFSADVQGAQANGLSAILVRKHHVDATVFHESLVKNRGDR
jgi:putative hydrolase of the HAD superfamily